MLKGSGGASTPVQDSRNPSPGPGNTRERAQLLATYGVRSTDSGNPSRPNSQLCIPPAPAPAPAQTPAPAGGVARTLHWDSIGLDEFLAGLTSRHLPPNDPQPRRRAPK
ncbi:hypothetical protein CFIO01_13332 [Colletotrichum fioriniae PJ7]|uniref:Uncharacterized protein n=1 Tax=Colletotrichum fioriniae PJ7 TaxID=1445577 RepID=A0A010QKJ5_9PEZI|nr:hypothetical protein CFIO01_13332 [Colletotrichum fioriniae PJ7]